MLNELRASSASRIRMFARQMIYGAAERMGGTGRTGSGSLSPGHDGLQVAGSVRVTATRYGGPCPAFA
jgi:hypothetical protein